MTGDAPGIHHDACLARSMMAPRSFRLIFCSAPAATSLVWPSSETEATGDPSTSNEFFTNNRSRVHTNRVVVPWYPPGTDDAGAGGDGALSGDWWRRMLWCPTLRERRATGGGAKNDVTLLR